MKLRKGNTWVVLLGPIILTVFVVFSVLFFRVSKTIELMIKWVLFQSLFLIKLVFAKNNNIMIYLFQPLPEMYFLTF